MRILRTRTIAEIFPFYSYEAEVDTEETYIYVNFYVRDGEKTTLDELLMSGTFWAYTVPLTEADTENDYYTPFDTDGALVESVLSQMISIWNENPVFVHSYEWNVIT